MPMGRRANTTDTSDDLVPLGSPASRRRSPAQAAEADSRDDSRTGPDRRDSSSSPCLRGSGIAHEGSISPTHPTHREGLTGGAAPSSRSRTPRQYQATPTPCRVESTAAPTSRQGNKEPDGSGDDGSQAHPGGRRRWCADRPLPYELQGGERAKRKRDDGQREDARDHRAGVFRSSVTPLPKSQTTTKSSGMRGGSIEVKLPITNSRVGPISTTTGATAYCVRL